MPIGDLDDAKDVLLSAWEYDAIRTRYLDGPVVFVEDEILRLVQHRIGAEEFFQVLKEPGIHGYFLGQPA